MSKRRRSIERTSPTANSRDARDRDVTPRTERLALVVLALVLALVVLALVLLYVGWSLCFELSTIPVDPTLGRRFTRLDILLNAPELIGFTLVPDDRAQPPVWSLGWLRDRLPLLAVAGLLAGSAFGYGYLALRWLGLRAALGRAERVFFAYGIGTSLLSLVTLACGVAGFLSRPALIGFVLAGPIGALGVEVLRRTSRRLESSGISLIGSLADGRGLSLYVLAAAPFVALMLAGAMLPPLEFDVKEYHLQGPKEFYQNGRVTFLSHNVYANMPFGTEMLSLLAMVVRGEWWQGALAGKAFLSFFPLLCALGVGAAGSRWFNPTAGALGALVYLTTPWTYQFATVAFVEGGMSFFLFAAVYAAALACSEAGRDDCEGAIPGRLFFLAGLMAGSAAACKYPGVVFVLVPVLLVAVLAGMWRGKAGQGGSSRDKAAMASRPSTSCAARKGAAAGFRFGGAVLVGAALTFGPWLVKNAVLAGNPTYPLLSSLFGGRGWNDQKAGKWLRVHTSPTFTLAELGAKLLDVSTRSDLQSPLIFGLAPLALVVAAPRRRVFGPAGYIVFVTAAWWLLTHRIDRFWAPVLPIAALLAGAGATWSDALVWKLGRTAVLVLVLVLNFAMCTITGYRKYTLPLDRARVDAARVEPAVLAVNRALPADAKVLVVGEAAVFDFERPVLYNTVFDDVWFEQWTRGKTGAETRETLTGHGITHVYVDWSEIGRYRSPGNYGFTDYVTREVFEGLVSEGILGPAQRIGTGQELYEVGD